MLSVDYVVSWGCDAAVTAVCEGFDEETVGLKPAGLWRVVELVGSARCLVWAKVQSGERKEGLCMSGRLLDTISHVVVRSFTRGKACPLSHECVRFKLVSCHLSAERQYVYLHICASAGSSHFSVPWRRE